MNKNIVWKNGMMNLLISIIFVYLNSRALKMGLEEAFVAYSIYFGIIVMVANTMFVAKIAKDR
jgi:hypothetical protein